MGSFLFRTKTTPTPQAQTKKEELDIIEDEEKLQELISELTKLVDERA